MPDISMCMNKSCESRNNCFRYRATPNPYRQAYSDFKVKEGDKHCDSYLELNDYYGYSIKPIEESNHA
jgi:hypothetical protein